MSSSPHVAVVGGGWAGIAATVDLLSAGVRVDLIEAAPRLGGRARSWQHHGHVLDNGQHLLVGAYHATLALMRRLQVDEDRVLLRQPFLFTQYDMQGRLCLRLSHSSPLYSAIKGVDLAWPMARLLAVGFRLPDATQTVGLWLQGQPEFWQRTLWEPLCLAIMNTETQYASARVSVSVLRSLIVRRKGLDLLIPRRPLSELLAQPAKHWLQRQGGAQCLSCRVKRVDVQGDRVVVQGRGLKRSYDRVVLATPADQVCRILGECVQQRESFHRLSFPAAHAPISTLSLRFNQELDLPEGMMGLQNSPLQWLFHNPMGAGRDWLSVVISGRAAHVGLSHKDWPNRIRQALAPWLPASCQLLMHQRITEQRATLFCSPEIEAIRPPMGRAMDVQQRVFIAGDYLKTGYPSTLEGAVLSGKQAAIGLLRALG